MDKVFSPVKRSVIKRSERLMLFMPMRGRVSTFAAMAKDEHQS